MITSFWKETVDGRNVRISAFVTPVVVVSITSSLASAVVALGGRPSSVANLNSFPVQVLCLPFYLVAKDCSGRTAETSASRYLGIHLLCRHSR